jgi:hypothetical protein
MSFRILALGCAALALAALAQAQDRAATRAKPELTIAPAQTVTTDQIGRIALAAESPAGIAPQDLAMLQRIAALYRSGKNDEATSLWVRTAQPAAGQGDHKDWVVVESWSYYVLHHAFIQPDAGLRAKAARVRSLRSAGANAQSASLDLQQAMERQSRAYTTLSNVMKKLHDTAKAAIQNVKS